MLMRYVGLVAALCLMGVSSPGVAIPGSYCLPVKTPLRYKQISFTAATLDGATMSFSNAPGAPAVVSFFATWCGPCNQEMPEFLKVAHLYEKRGLKTILVDVREQPDAVRRFIKKFGIDFPVEIDTDGSVMDMFGLHAIPSTAFYNDRGVLTCLVQDSMEPYQIDNEASAAVGGWMPKP